MNILFDSDVAIMVLRGDAEHVRAMEQALEQGARCFYSPITLTEVYTGMRPREARATEEFFSWLHCAEVTEVIGRKAGAYMAEFRASHSLQIPDAIIGATAGTLGLWLWTRNRNHYPMRDLRIWEPQQS